MNDYFTLMRPSYIPVKLKERMFRGLGAQGFGQVVQIIIRLSEVPLFLVFWGTQIYGEWLMLSAIPAYLSLGDGGFAAAACRDMTMKSAAGDNEGVLVVFQTTWLLILTVSIVLWFIAFAFVALVPLEKWLGFTAMNSREARLVFLLLVSHVLVGFQGGLLNGGFWVTGSYPTGMAYIALTQLLEFGGLVIAVLLDGGPVQAASGYLGGRICGTLLMWLAQRRISVWLCHGFRRASFSELRRLAAPAFASLAFPLGNALNIQGLRLVVGLALGPSAVAIFTPLRTLSRLAMQPRAVLNQLMEPEMALAFGAQDTELLKRLCTRSCQLSFWGCLIAAVTVGVCAHWIFPLWTGGKIVIEWNVFTLLFIGVLINSLWYAAFIVPYATNQHVRIAGLYCIIYGAGAFVIGYFGAKFMGLSGAATALIMVESLMVPIVVRIALKIVNLGLSEWLREIMLPPLDIIWKLLSLKRIQSYLIKKNSHSSEKYKNSKKKT